MTIEDFIKQNAQVLKDKKSAILIHRGFSKKTQFGDQVMTEQRFDPDGDPLKRIIQKKLIRGKYTIPYEYLEAGWVEYKPEPVKSIRKKITQE